MKSNWSVMWLAAGTALAAAIGWSAAAQEAQSDTVARARVIVRSSEAAPAAVPDGVAEVLKMVDAKVSSEVIKAYIEGSSVSFNPAAADIIALKQHGATDDITTALLKRGAELRAQAAQAGVAVPVQSTASAPRSLDPDSYDYFAYYYLYPRTLANVNQRLGLYPMPYSSLPYSYGYSYGYPGSVGSFYSGFAPAGRTARRGLVR